MNRTPEILAQLRTEILSAPAGELPSIRGQLAALEAELLVRLTMPQAAPTSNEPADDQLIDVDATAAMLGMSPRWVRDHQDELPRVNLPGSAVRFSTKRLTEFIKRRSY